MLKDSAFGDVFPHLAIFSNTNSKDDVAWKKISQSVLYLTSAGFAATAWLATFSSRVWGAV